MLGRRWAVWALSCSGFCSLRCAVRAVLPHSLAAWAGRSGDLLPGPRVPRARAGGWPA